MSLEGIVQNGSIILPEGSQLPEGTLVRIEPVSDEAKTLAARFAAIVGIVDELPSDMAKNHDHYLHGAPKK